MCPASSAKRVVEVGFAGLLPGRRPAARSHDGVMDDDPGPKPRTFDNAGARPADLEECPPVVEVDPGPATNIAIGGDGGDIAAKERAIQLEHFLTHTPANPQSEDCLQGTCSTAFPEGLRAPIDSWSERDAGPLGSHR